MESERTQWGKSKGQVKDGKQNLPHNKERYDQRDQDGRGKDSQKEMNQL